MNAKVNATIKLIAKKERRSFTIFDVAMVKGEISRETQVTLVDK